MKKKMKRFVIIIELIFTLSVFFGCTSYTRPVLRNFENKKLTRLKMSYDDWDPPIKRGVGYLPISVFIGDADNDGYNDIVAANIGDDDISIILWNSISDDWNPQIRKPTSNSPISVFIGDANNDGFNDIVTADRDSNVISIFLWNSSINDWNIRFTKSAGNDPYSVSIGDANNDGFNDVATSNEVSNDVSVLIWNETIGDWNDQIVRSVGVNPRSIFLDDANNDGYIDIVTGNDGGNSVSIILWNSTSNDWDVHFMISMGTNPGSVFVGDANNDGYNDIATANYFSDDLSIRLWNPISENWDPQIRKSVDATPINVFIGDANNDGFNDIVSADMGSNKISIFLWNPSINDWNARNWASVTTWPSSIFIGDANNDGYNDIVTTNYFSDDVAILLWHPLPFIKIKTPRTKIYTEPMIGYYLATYGFENDEIGSFPHEWNPESNGGTCKVIQSLGGHNKVVELYDSSVTDFVGYIGMTNNFSSKQTAGTVEFFFHSTDVDKRTEIFLYENSPNDGIYLTIMNNRTYYYKDMTYVGLDPIESNKWHHFSIKFNSTLGEFWLWINGTRITKFGGDYPYQNNNTGMKHLTINTYVYDMEYSSYIDAVGYSSDPIYDVGDNLNEGMLISFEKNAKLDWIGYSLDELAIITIMGNKTIPIPEDGFHNIQIFGNDSLGYMTHSELVNFTIDTKIPEIIINSPIENNVFAEDPPIYNITIIEENMISAWYTLDGGITNISITELSGNISLETWLATPNGPITIKFYVKDIVGNIGYNNVNIIKETVSEAKPRKEDLVTIIITITTLSAGAIIGTLLYLNYRKRKKVKG